MCGAGILSWLCCLVSPDEALEFYSEVTASPMTVHGPSLVGSYRSWKRVSLQARPPRYLSSAPVLQAALPAAILWVVDALTSKVRIRGSVSRRDRTIPWMEGYPSR